MKTYLLKVIYLRYRKIALYFSCGIVFLFGLIYNTPAWMLGKAVSHYSNGRVMLYNEDGTFWNGGGLLVAVDHKSHIASPLLLLNWKVTLGLRHFVDVKFYVGDARIVDAYLDKTGLNLNQLNLDLSLTQVSQLLDIIGNFGLSGNLSLKCEHLLVNKVLTGSIIMDISDLSSSFSPVNPLGSYEIMLDGKSGRINVQTTNNAILKLSGNGSISALTLSASVAPDASERMLQFVTALGMPSSDGTHELKIF